MQTDSGVPLDGVAMDATPPQEQPEVTEVAEEDATMPKVEPEQEVTPEIVTDEEEDLEQLPIETHPPSTSLKSEEISYNAAGWEIHGTIYENREGVPKKVIMLLPMLGHTRNSYPMHFIERLHDEIPDSLILAIDMRGHGESTNLGTWENFDTADFKDMKGDIVHAKSYFRSRFPAIEEYYVVGASIGSTAALTAGAQDRSIVKVAMLSPGMEYRGVNIERAAREYQRPLLLIASSGDSYSYSSVYEIEELSPSQKTIKVYGGSEHGTDLFEATKDDEDPLTNVLVSFLKD